MLVIAGGAGHDAVMIQELLSLASIFACDHISLLQHTDCTQSDVFEIADGRGHEVESRLEILFSARTHRRESSTR